MPTYPAVGAIIKYVKIGAAINADPDSFPAILKACMRLTTREVAQIFNVSEADIQRWVRDERLPAQVVLDQYRFHKAELLEWAMLRHEPIPAALFLNDASAAAPYLANALRSGGVLHGLSGVDANGTLAAIVEQLPHVLPQERSLLLGLLQTRESLGTTIIAEGIAIPHPSRPLVLEVNEPQVSVCYFDPPLQCSPTDIKPLWLLLVLIAPSVNMHMQLLAEIATALRYAPFLTALKQRSELEALATLATAAVLGKRED